MTNPLYDTLFHPHRNNPNPFLRLKGSTPLSYRGHLEQAARYAGVLLQEGLSPGDRVAAQVEKSPEALALYAACVQIGAIYLPLNTAYTTEELRYFLEDSEARLLVCDSARTADLSHNAAPSGCVLLTLNADGTGSLPDRAAAGEATTTVAERVPEDVAAILYTSGTTGRPKGAMLTHANLLSNAEALVSFWRFTEADTLLHALPVFHTHGLFVATHVTLAAGASMIFLPRFDTDAVMDSLPDATTMMGVPTFYTRLLDSPRFTKELVSHIRLFISGSAPLLAETHSRFEERTGHRILERYGLTETSMNTSNPYNGERIPGTVGLPLFGVEVRITASDGSILSTDEIGEIEIRGPNVFKGYWRNPEKTAEAISPDGWFSTGDLGLLAANGYLHIVGREKDLIISGGYNIYPKEIELLLDRQPGVLESAVIGVPHADFGESVLAVLIPDTDKPLDLDAITDTLAKRLARFKHPRRLMVADSLPRNAMGKVQKALLRDRYRDALNEQLSPA